MKIKYVLHAVTLACLICTNSLADSKILTLDDAISKTLDLSPVVKEIELASIERKADAFDAKTLPNPTLDSELGVPTSWNEQKGDNEINISLSQPFRLSHGTLRNRLATFFEQVADTEKEQNVLELITKVRLSYARLWLLSQRERALGEIQPKAKSLSGFVSSGTKEGAYGSGDSAVFKSQTGKTEAEILGIRAEKLIAETEFTSITTIDPTDLILAEPSLSSFEDSFVNGQLANNGFKVQNRARKLLDLAQADKDVADRDAFPELRPRLFYSRTNEGADIVGVGISFDLPFYSQNTSDRMRKSAQLSASEAKNTFYQSEVFKSSVLKSAKMYGLRKQQLQVYEKQVLPSVKEALNAYEKQVRGGQGSIFQLWATLQEYLDVQERYLELWNKSYSDYQQLSILLGQDL